jgi:hypothetical protein
MSFASPPASFVVDVNTPPCLLSPRAALSWQLRTADWDPAREYLGASHRPRRVRSETRPAAPTGEAGDGFDVPLQRLLSGGDAGPRRGPCRHDSGPYTY